MTCKPPYGKPLATAIKIALREASEIAVLRRVKLVPMLVQDIMPRERIEAYPEALVEAWRTKPRSIPPIVVYRRPKRFKQPIRILDGHHRYEAAMWAGIECVWVLETVD